MLEGMPEPGSLRLLAHEGETVVLSGRWVLFRFPVADTGMRRLAMIALTEAGHSGRSVRGTPELSVDAAQDRPRAGLGWAGQGDGPPGEAERGAAGAGPPVGRAGYDRPGDRGAARRVRHHDQSAGECRSP